MKNKVWLQFLGFLSTPPLWEDSSLFKLKQFSIPQVNYPEIPDFPTELPSLETNYVLGKRIEDFYSLILSRSSEFNILAQRLQIFRNKITVGELDFILEVPEEEKVIHLEVVYKFYIYDPTIKEELDRWIGPNRKDTLIRKLAKLKQKQLPLLYREDTIKALEKRGVEYKNVKQEVSFLAHLFIPGHLKQEVFSQINNKGIVGTWIHLKEFIKNDFGMHKFFIPHKQDWPIDPSYNTTWLTYDKIFVEVEEKIASKRSPLIWMRTSLGNFERFFIVWW
ncbi:MAG TPA: DUF1853 family protein [Gillisia sp.]|nr:DUF1853 family protein [Gillisia sp.]